MLRPGPSRRDAEVLAAIDEEFAFHLACIEKELRDQGHDADHARRAALERFGDVASLRSQCRGIILKERIMLQRINTVLMVIVLLAVIAVATQVAVTQRYNTLAIQSMNDQLAEMKLQSELQLRASGRDSAEQAAALERERAKANALQSFLVDMLIAADPHASNEVNIEAVLEAAESKLETEIITDPDIEARIRETIEQTRQRLEDQTP